MKHLAKKLISVGRTIGPFLAIELLMPGGSFLAVGLWLYRTPAARQLKIRRGDDMRPVQAVGGGVLDTLAAALFRALGRTRVERSEPDRQTPMSFHGRAGYTHEGGSCAALMESGGVPS